MSDELWYTTFNGNAWVDSIRMRDTANAFINSNFGPALAWFQDRVFCAFNHEGPTHDIKWTSYDPKKREWAAMQAIPSSSANTSDAPSLVVYNKTLYMAIHVSETGYFQLLRYTNGQFDYVTQVRYAGQGRPCLVVFDSRLYLFQRDRSTSSIYFSYQFPKGTWSSRTKVVSTKDAPTSTSGIAVAAYQGKLFLFYRDPGDRDYNLRYRTLERRNAAISAQNNIWSTSTQIPGPNLDIFMGESPVELAVLDGKLYCVWSSAVSDLHYASFDGNSWSSPTPLPGNRASAARRELLNEGVLDVVARDTPQGRELLLAHLGYTQPT